MFHDDVFHAVEAHLLLGVNYNGRDLLLAHEQLCRSRRWLGSRQRWLLRQKQKKKVRVIIFPCLDFTKPQSNSTVRGF